MKWKPPQGKVKVTMKSKAPWEGANAIAGIERISRDIDKRSIRAVRIGDEDNRAEVFIDKTYDDDFEMEYRLNELWEAMKGFEDWERISYLLDPI